MFPMLELYLVESYTDMVLRYPLNSLLVEFAFTDAACLISVDGRDKKQRLERDSFLHLTLPSIY